MANAAVAMSCWWVLIFLFLVRNNRIQPTLLSSVTPLRLASFKSELGAALSSAASVIARRGKGAEDDGRGEGGVAVEGAVQRVLAHLGIALKDNVDKEQDVKRGGWAQRLLGALAAGEERVCQEIGVSSFTHLGVGSMLRFSQVKPT